MYILELTFECYRDTSLGEAERAIVHYLDMLRYQGQILGREFPTSMHEGYFVSRVVCPEQDSLHPDNQSELVALAEQGLHQAGLLAPNSTCRGGSAVRTARTRAQSRGSVPAGCCSTPASCTVALPCAVATIRPHPALSAARRRQR